MLDRRVPWVGDVQGKDRNRGNPSCAQRGTAPLDRALSDLQSREGAALCCLTSFCPFTKSSVALNMS